VRKRQTRAGARIALVAEAGQVSDAEESVLSAMMMDASAINEVRALKLTADDFTDEKRKLVFEALIALSDREITVDPITLSAQLGPNLKAIGGKNYIAELIDVVPTAANVRHHAQLVLNAAKSHALATALEENARGLRDGATGPAEVLARLQPAFSLLSAADSTNSLAMYDDEEILSLPPVDFLVEGLLPARGACEMHGPPGVGKSFVALDIALSVAAGHEFFGHKVRRSAVMYVAAEGSAGLPNRVRTWKHARGVSGRLGVRFVTEPINLLDSSSVGRFIAAARVSKERIGLFVIDTLARCMTGGDENSAQDMGRAIDSADRIRRDLGACVLIVHHTRKDGDTERGSTALRGAMDAMIGVKGEDGDLTIACEKMKDAAPFETIALKLQPMFGSCVITAKTDCHQSSGRLSKNERSIIESLTRDFDEDGTYSGTLQKTSGVEERTFYRAVNHLVEMGYVAVIKEGRLRRYQLTLDGRAAIGDTRQIGDKKVSGSNRQRMAATPHLLEMGGLTPIDSGTGGGELAAQRALEV
jgi:DNA-binding transcriptional ArsR family regulator